MIINGQESLPGGYSIKTLKITSQKGGSIDVDHLLAQLVITETINAPVITGRLTILDPFNIVSNLPVMEGDKLEGSLSTWEKDSYASQCDSDGSIDFEYEIFKIGGAIKRKQDISFVTLHFCSPLWSDNMKGRVSKAFCQTPYTSAAKQIFDEYLKKGGLQQNIKTKELEIEQSDEMFNFIIPNWKPLEAILWLAGRAWKDKAACYKFFENKEKFKLVTLTKLMKEGGKLTYHTTSQNMGIESKPGQLGRFDPGLIQQRYNYLYDISFLNTQDVNVASSGYLFGRRMLTHDLMYKRVKDYYFTGPEADNYKLGEPRDYKKDFEDMEAMNGGEPLVEDKIAKSLGPKEGDEKMVMFPLHNFEWTGVEDNFKPDKWLRQHKSMLQHLEFYNVEASAPGNFTMKAGDVINVEWMSPQASQVTDGKKKPETDKRHKGKWLVTYVNRVFGHTYDSHAMRIRLARNDRELSPNPIWEGAEEMD